MNDLHKVMHCTELEHCGLTRGLLRVNYSISQKSLPSSVVGRSLISLSFGPSSSSRGSVDCRFANAARGIRFCIRQSSSLSLSLSPLSLLSLSLSLSSLSAIIPFTALAYLPVIRVRSSPCRPSCLFEQSDSALVPRS